MLLDLICPKCGACLMTADADKFMPKMGAKAKCKGCPEVVEVSKPNLEQHLSAEQRQKVLERKAKAKEILAAENSNPEPAVQSPPSAQPSGTASGKKPSDRPLFGKWWTYLATAVLCLGVGFFVGRIYFVYQVANAFGKAAQEMSKPLSDINTPTKVEAEAPTPPKARYFELVTWDKAFKKGEYSDHYHITYTLKNVSDKTIKLIDGRIGFNDLLGEELYAISLEKDVLIKPNATADFSGEYSINQFINKQARLAAIDKKDINAIIKVRKLVTTDNEVIEP